MRKKYYRNLTKKNRLNIQIIFNEKENDNFSIHIYH